MSKRESQNFKIESRDTPFWATESQEVIKFLESDGHVGLSEAEAADRLKSFGPNVIEKSGSAPGFSIFLNQFKSPLILILLFAGAVTLSIGHLNDSLFIFSALIINTVLGFYQEYKAEKALAELKTYIKERTRVIRDGVEKEIDAANLVLGDIVRLSQGDRVPADGRILSANDLQIDEAVLTGESLPAEKTIQPAQADAGVGDQNSMVFAGTLVTQGIGTVVICRTDLQTELGKIADLVQSTKREETPLQMTIKRFSVQIGIIVGIFTLLIFWIGILRGFSVVEMFLTSVAIAISAVPEGLPIAMTVILAIGVERMAKRKGVVRKLVAAEALGSATVIMTDKTGTLTMAKMELSKVIPVLGGDENELLELALLNTDVLVENPSDHPSEWRMRGRIIEMALVKSAALRGITVEEAKKKLTVINSLPFNAVNKFSVSFTRTDGKHLLVFVGAPDILLNHSTLGSAEKEKMLDDVNSLAAAGELILGIATKEVEPKGDFIFSKDLRIERLSFGGFIVLRDPIRSNVKEAIRQVEAAGIKIILITGDHRGTAESVAREVGIPIAENSSLDAPELRSLEDAELKNRLRSVRVISRVSPEDKMRVAKILQEMGDVVAMTGDGVNDAPSLKQADIGIAMGSGTEVARDVADLVLLDDNFETIAAAVKEGRQIVNNIRKAVVYLLSNVAAELFLIGGALVTGLALPLNALQILWVNFFSDSFPAIAFGFEKDIDGFSARPRTKGLFDPAVKFLILFIGMLTSAFLFGLYWLLLKLGYDEDIVRTFIFAAFGTYTLFLSFSIRSLEKSILEYPLFSNKYLNAGIAIGFILMAIAIYAPLLQNLLHTVALPLGWVLGVILIGVLNIAAVEAGKWLFRPRG